MILSFFVDGTPVPQPRYTQGKGGAAFIKPPEGCKVHPIHAWRDLVTLAAKDALSKSWVPTFFPLGCPLRLSASIRLPRPKSHWGTGRNAGKLKPSAPTWAMGKGDLGNYFKGIEDAINHSGLWLDDRLVVAYGSSEVRYHGVDERPGALIWIETLDSIGGVK